MKRKSTIYLFINFKDLGIKLFVWSIFLFSIGSIGQERAISLETMSLQSEWIATQNDKKQDTFLYNDASGLFANDSLFIGPISINKALENLYANIGALVKYDTLASYQLNEGQALVLGVYTTAKGQKMPSIIGWRKEDAWIKSFEVIEAKSIRSEVDMADIDLLRSSWELYSNQHRPDLIVKNVFAPNGRYFYNGIENKGQQIADAYGYMTNETYAIDLNPRKVYQVTDKLVYEIGVYKSNGQGLYFLLWTKEEGTWKLLLDFNF